MLPPVIYANTIIKRALDSNTTLSPMKLQKLLYFTYARCAFKHDTALFADQFEPWPYGPVVESVYEQFKNFGKKSIDDYYKDCDGKVKVVSQSHTQFLECFNEVWAKFSMHNGIHLSKITHEDDTAWSNAWVNDKQFLNWEDIKKDGERLFN